MSPSTVRIHCDAVTAQLTGPAEAIALTMEMLTVETPGARFTPAFKRKMWDGKTRFLRRPSNIFLAGLRFRVQRELEVAGFNVTVEDRPLAGIAFPIERLVGIKLRPYQITAAQEGVLRRRVTIQCPTGAGKTNIGAEICRQLGGPVLWLVHRKTLLDQTVVALRAVLGPTVSVVGLEAGAAPDRLGLVTVAMVQSVRSILRSPKTWAAFRTLVIDEAHHTGADSWSAVAEACTGATARIGLSGTPLTKDPVKNLRLEGVTGEIVTVESTSSLASAGFLATPTIRFVVPDPMTYPTYAEIRDEVLPDWKRDPRRLSTMGGRLFAAMYTRGIVKNPIRHRALFAGLAPHLKAGERALLLCSRIEHGEILFNGALAWKLLDGHVWWINGQDQSARGDAERRSALADFRSGTGGRLLIASNIVQEGVDIPEIDVMALAGAGGGMDETGQIAIPQSIGRALRPRPDKASVLIYDAVDGRFPAEDKDYLAQHTLTRIRLFRRLNFAIEGLPPHVLAAI